MVRQGVDKTKFARYEAFRDMGMAKGSRFQYAVAAVCLLGALLTGCSRDPNVRKQKYLESGQRYFDKGQYREAEIQFENAIQVDSRFADAITNWRWRR